MLPGIRKKQYEKLNCGSLALDEESSWTLAGELRQLSGANDLDSWLYSLELIKLGDTVATLETVRDWYRSGAETYGLHFAVVTSGGDRQDCFMKACVAYAAGIPLAEIFAEWLRRRNQVSELGVDTPRLYGIGTAILVEEFVPYTLSEALARATDRTGILRSLASTTARLVNAGFMPVSAHDWRSRGQDVVLIDFGQDLGPAGIGAGFESGLLSEVIDNLANDGIRLSTANLRLIGSVYEQLLRV